MTCMAIVARGIYSIAARARGGCSSFLLCVGVAYALGGGSVAHAIMGESAENRGLVLADEKIEVLLACVLGTNCELDGSFFRNLPANQIFRDAAVIESAITVPGFGFGSLLSTEDDDDTLCWTGDDQRECVEIFSDEAAGTVNGDVIDAQADSGSECADAEDLFGQAPGTFDYLVRFDTADFGQADAVVVVTCDGVAAAALALNGPTIHTDVVVTAHRSMSAYDALRYGGGYCCR
jgi:hypothetical protein